MSDAEIAKAFHEAYERLAPEHGYETRKDSAVPWAAVPERNRRLMIATVGDLLDRRVIFAESGDDAEEQLAGVLAALDGLADGAEASRSRDFGRGVAHAVRIIRAQIR